MSLGDDSSAGPFTGLIGKVAGTFDKVLGPAFGKKSTPSVVNAPSPPPTAPVSKDTPGRHKSLLGA